MCKWIQKFIVVFLLIFMLTTSLTANAAILPVKDAWILNSDCIIILRENGDLLFANSIDSQTSETIAQNVSDFDGSRIILYNDGKVATISSVVNNNKTTFNIEVVANNAKSISKHSLRGFDYTYIDNNNTLKGKPSHAYSDIIDIMTNVRCCYSYLWSNYIITADDKLYSFKYEEPGILNDDTETITLTEILTNVKDMKDNAVLRNNGDLYVLNNNNPPERIGQNIRDIKDVVTDDKHSAGDVIVYYIDSNNNLYKNTKLLKKGVSKIFYTMGSYDLYYITLDNKLYLLGNWDNTYYQEDNAYAILGGTSYFFQGTDGHLYNKQSYKSGYSKLYLENINKVKTGSCYLFITNSGELYAAFEDSWEYPFLTSFSQKNTKVVINNQNVNLSSKIQMVNNRSMYPFRECLENMGATVLWDSANQIAIGEYNGITIEFPIGKSEYWVNGTKYNMDVPSYIDNSIGRTYIPIRYAAEGLGFTVDWAEGKTEDVIYIYN